MNRNALIVALSAIAIAVMMMPAVDASECTFDGMSDAAGCSVCEIDTVISDDASNDSPDNTGTVVMLAIATAFLILILIGFIGLRKKRQW